MPDLDISTPALLFSAISLLLLAFTNRFLSIAALVRSLHDSYLETRSKTIYCQIENLKSRLQLIKNMQVAGLASLLLCVLCMLLIYIGLYLAAKIIFAIALILMILSLSLSIREIFISVKALNLHLSDIENTERDELS